MKRNKINKYSIVGYSLNELDYVKANCRKTKGGYPLFWPTKNEIGQRMILSFVDAQIYEVEKKILHKEVANFNILEEDHFSQDDPLAKTKIKYIVALLSPSYLVKGGVYYKGQYFTGKMTMKKALFLLKSFLNSYFHIEDTKYIREYFLKDTKEDIPFWPTKSNSGQKDLIFSAVNAYIRTVDGEVTGGPYNFDITIGETFDLTKKEDRIKAEVFRALIDEERYVSGFYYKGALLSKNLTKEYKLYLEKSFIKKNFTVNQRDYLLTSITKDSKSGLPLFWPMKDDDGRGIVVSVINAEVPGGDKIYNFDIYEDEKIDLNNHSFQEKLSVIRKLFYQPNACKGGLYLDGLLIPGYLNSDEVEHHKEKVEKALRIYITDSEDFLRINRDFRTDDFAKLLRLSPFYLNYHLDNFTEVYKFDASYKKGDEIVLRIHEANAINSNGELIFKDNINGEYKIDDKLDENTIKLLKYLTDTSVIVRGEVFYKGNNVIYRRGKDVDLLKNEVTSRYPEVKVNDEEDIHKIVFDKSSHMPLYWPTRDNKNRSVLLSVVDADVHFKTPHGIVKAVNNASFDIYEGETFGLVGESGSGKTTISRAILGINKLSKGAIYYRGKIISSKLSKRDTLKTKKNIQMVFQDPAASLNERANVDYIVSEGLYNFKMFKTNEERLEKVTNMLNQVGLLPEHLSRYPHEFSGGQRQRIGIARALVIEPQLVLADEPISALDVSIRAQVLNLLKKLQTTQGLTYLFIAHDLSIIRYISDRIAVMHNGYIVELGNAEEIYENPLHPYTRSLLTAIPQPDPRSKEERKKIPYEMGDTKYEECHWEEFLPNHYVLVNEKIKKDVLKRIKNEK